jgi:hypothetical protein
MKTTLARPANPASERLAQPCPRAATRTTGSVPTREEEGEAVSAVTLDNDRLRAIKALRLAKRGHSADGCDAVTDKPIVYQVACHKCGIELGQKLAVTL